MIEYSTPFFRTMIEHSTIGFAIHDDNGQFIDFNTAMHSRLGYSRDEFITKTVFDIEVSIDANTLKHEIWPTLNHHESLDIKSLHRRKDGTIYPTIINITCIKTPEKSLFLAIVLDVTEAEQAKSQLEELAMTDELTQVANRRAFIEALQSDLSFIQRIEGKLSLLMLDIDFFKKINDTYGHPVGDKVLQHFTTRIKQELRVEDLLARLGGEEFGIMLRDSDLKQAQRLAERIRRAIENLVIDADDVKLNITVSIGIAAASSQNIDMNDLLLRADNAVYKAKSEGRNRVVLAEQ